MIDKIDNYLSESSSVNKFGKLIRKYTTDLKKLQDNTIKQVEFFIKQINDPEELDDMIDMLDLDDEIQDAISSIISAKIGKI